MIEKVAPGTMDKRKTNLRAKDIFNVMINHNAAIEAAKEAGCNIVNIGPQDFVDKQEHLILAFIWQLLKLELLRGVNEVQMAEYFIEAEMTKADVASVEGAHIEATATATASSAKKSPEMALLRWFNALLHRVEPKVPEVRNFGEDIKGSEAYIVLMNQISPDMCSLDGLNIPDLDQRAEFVVANAFKLGCNPFVTPYDIVQGNRKLNLAFTATLFHKYAECAEKRRHDDLVIQAREEALRKKQEELEAIQREEEERRRREEEELARIEQERLEEEERVRREEEEREAAERAAVAAAQAAEEAERARLDAEAQSLRDEEARLQREAEAEETRLRAEAEAEARAKLDEEARVRAEAEAEEARMQEEAQSAQRQEEEAARRKEERRREEAARLERIAEEERERFRKLRHEEERERMRKIEEAQRKEDQEAEYREEAQRKRKEVEDKKRQQIEQRETERSECPVVLFVTDAPEEFAAAEAHLTSQGRNAMFCTMEDVLELIERTQSDHIVLTGLFNTNEEDHDAELDVASSIVEKYGEKKKVICFNSIIQKKPILQKRCEAFGLSPVKRGNTLWKLLGIKDAPLQGAKPKTTTKA